MKPESDKFDTPPGTGDYGQPRPKSANSLWALVTAVIIIIVAVVVNYFV